MMDGIRFTELLEYGDEETRRWKSWFAQNPAALDLPVDVAGAGTVRELLTHIFLVERHFASAVTEGAASFEQSRKDAEKQPPAELDEIFGISEEASQKYREFLASATPEDLATVLNLSGRMELKASKRKMIVQALTHSIRHWAQLATSLRQQGMKQDWIHDFLMSKAME
jgi:uncharacterized damage-inducible protein DinB